jgi:RHS repeat-associated protein
VGIGLRTSGQNYGATDTNRQKYGLTERDATTGLDHTWWRKYESLGGRWTSPDPVRGSIGAPQSFNAYTYAANDPVNLIDPTGLDPQDPIQPPTTPSIDPETGDWFPVPGIGAVVTITGTFEGGTIGGGALGMFGDDANHRVAVINLQELSRGTARGPAQQQKTAPLSQQQKQAVWNSVYNNCLGRKEQERQRLVKSMEDNIGANIGWGCIIGGAVGAISGALGGGFLAGPVGAAAGAAGGAAVGFHEGCAIGAGSTMLAETLMGNIGQLRRLKDKEAISKKFESECRTEADKAVSRL